tara:strand:- start:96 stop:206 length:111 start_codon:yes stop_codon:yes gene_type:complete
MPIRILPMASIEVITGASSPITDCAFFSGCRFFGEV